MTSWEDTDFSDLEEVFRQLEEKFDEEYFMGVETCECGSTFVLFAPFKRAVVPCDMCGLLLDIMLEE